MQAMKMGRFRHVRAIWLVPLAYALSSMVHAEIKTYENLRAIGPHFKESVVKFIATKTELQQIDSRMFQQIESPTPSKVIGKLCGHENNFYVTEFLSINHLAPEKFNMSGEFLNGLVWPSCLYVKFNNEGRKVSAKAGDSYASIYKRLTGSNGSKPTYLKFFGVSALELDGPMPVGKSISYPYSSASVSVKPIIREENFIRGLSSAAERDDTNLRDVVNVLGTRQGSIEVAVPGDDSNPTSCTPFSGSPFDGQAIVHAYQHTAQGRETGIARLIIIDNGFFGATDPGDDSLDIFDGSPFPTAYFGRLSEDRPEIALSLNLATQIIVNGDTFQVNSIGPINPPGDSAPDEVSGHGTHVTGLTIGGPYFKDMRAQLRPNGMPWVQISIMNVGRGEKSLVPNAQQEILRTLTLTEGTGLIVNASFSYDADADSIDTFSAMFSRATKTLFVIAAGNGGEQMSQNAVPAMLGGLKAENQITVAALGGNNNLASFSNFGLDYVDLAAPGCGIKSWISNTPDEVAMSGTSMAAPLVSFAASLVSSLRPDIKGKLLKARLLVSGDLLPVKERDKVFSRTRLNIPKALYVNHDYVQADEEELLGSIVVLPRQASQCSQGSNVRSAGLWSYKRHEAGALIFHGKNLGKLQGHCSAAEPEGGVLVFSATHQIGPDGIRPLSPPQIRTIPMASVNEIVYRSP